MEADLTPQQQPPVDTSAPTEPAPDAQASLAAAVAAVLKDDPRAWAALQSLYEAREAAHQAAIAAMEADHAERAEFLRSVEKTEAARKAAAQQASSAKRLVSEHLEIDARAAWRLVDLLVGPAVIR